MATAGAAREGLRHLEPVFLAALLRDRPAVALGLLSLGIKPGDRIAIASENTPEWFYADLGAQMLGAVVVGIYPTNPWAELQYIVRHSGARVVITGDQEQTDKVLDAIANNDGLPALEAIVCVDMKGMRHYRQSQLMSFEALCERGKRYAPKTPTLMPSSTG